MLGHSYIVKDTETYRARLIVVLLAPVTFPIVIGFRISK